MLYEEVCELVVCVLLRRYGIIVESALLRCLLRAGPCGNCLYSKLSLFLQNLIPKL